MWSVKVSVLFLVLCVFSIVGVNSDSPDDIFNVDKIVEYNRLIGCFSSINLDFQACNNWAKDQADKYLETFEGVFGKSSEIVKMAKCCGVWVIRDCWVKAAKEKCPHATVELVNDMPTKFMPQIGTLCKDYTDGHINCKMPLFIGGGIILSLLLLVAIVTYLAIVIFRRRRKEKTSQENLKADNNNDVDV